MKIWDSVYTSKALLFWLELVTTAGTACTACTVRTSELTDSKCVESSADDDCNCQKFAKTENILHSCGKTDAQAVDQGYNSWNFKVEILVFD